MIQLAQVKLQTLQDIWFAREPATFAQGIAKVQVSMQSRIAPEYSSCCQESEILLTQFEVENGVVGEISRRHLLSTLLQVVQHGRRHA